MVARVLVDATRRRLAVTAGGQRTAALWRMARAAIGRLSWGVADQALSSISTGAAATVGLAAGACVPAVAAVNSTSSQPRNYDIRRPAYALGLPWMIAVIGGCAGVGLHALVAAPRSPESPGRCKVPPLGHGLARWCSGGSCGPALRE